MIELTHEPIDFTALTESVRDDRAGAVLMFLGTVREFTGEQQTVSLHYEAYSEMALASLQQLADEARQRFPVIQVALVHRTGPLQLGDISVAVAVSAAHRGQAFEAGRWLIDTLKQRTPIWKQENYADGRTEWVHPGDASPSTSANMQQQNPQQQTLAPDWQPRD